VSVGEKMFLKCRLLLNEDGNVVMKWYGANWILLIYFAWLLGIAEARVKGSMRLELAWGFFLSS
jgi:hypothetical protein